MRYKRVCPLVTDTWESDTDTSTRKRHTFLSSFRLEKTFFFIHSAFVLLFVFSFFHFLSFCYSLLCSFCFSFLFFFYRVGSGFFSFFFSFFKFRSVFLSFYVFYCIFLSRHIRSARCGVLFQQKKERNRSKDGGATRASLLLA